MAFTASATAEVQTGGNDTNAGFFDPGVAGMATNLAVSSANTASPVASSATYNFVAGDVGNWLYLKSGTSSTPGWYKIVSVASNQATLNGTIGQAALAAGTPNTVAGCGTASSLTTCTWTVDYSQVTGAAIAFSDMVEDGTTNTKFTSAAHPAADNLIGNIINVTGGTGFTVQRVAIVSRTTTTYNVDKSLGTLSSTGGTGNLGGAFASPALPFSVTVGFNTVFIKTGSYTISSSSTNAVGGIISLTTGSIRAEGYGTVRGDRASRPTLTASGIASVILFNVTISGADGFPCNIAVNGANLTGVVGFSLERGVNYLLSATNCPGGGFAITGNVPTVVSCTATGCGTAGFSGAFRCVLCEANGNTATGFNISGTGYCSWCIASGNSGASTDGFVGALLNFNCVAYNNGRHGFNVTGAALVNCIAEANTGTGLLVSASSNNVSLNNGVYNNGTNSNISSSLVNTITGTASFFVAAASGNFALNANAGGGALLRAAGIPGVTPDGLSTGYADVGAIQSPPLWPPARAFTAGGVN